MRKLTSKEIVLLIVLVFIVSGALYYNYFFRPYQGKMIELDVNINTDNQRLLTLQSQQQSIIRDTEKLNNELAGVEEEFYDIPEGIDEPQYAGVRRGYAKEHRRQNGHKLFARSRHKRIFPDVTDSFDVRKPPTRILK